MKKILWLLIAAMVFAFCVTPLSAAPKFTDVKNNDWFAEYVYDLAGKGIIRGMTETTFVPNGLITRAQFAQILAAASGENISAYAGKASFGDVSASAWYASSVQWAYEKGIVKGLSETKFAPDANITREQMAAMIKRYADHKGITLPRNNAKLAFKDDASISVWAKDNVYAMQQAGIINGYRDGNGFIFNPKGNAKRSEASTMISVFLTIAGGDDNPGVGDNNPVASGTCGANLTWILYKSGTLTISGTGAMTNWDSSNDVPWASLRSAIKKVVIEKGVTTIGFSAFENCDALTSVTMGSSVTTIEPWAFGYCHALTSVTIPDSVTTIGDCAFHGCAALPSVTIGNSVTTIGDYAFGDCDALTSVTMGNSVTTIGDWAFENCDALTDVYYRGDKADKANLYIDSGNDDLINAAWHYNSGDDNPVSSGTCGENLTWTLDKNGTLTISGTGAMKDWMPPFSTPWSDDSPWAALLGSKRPAVKKVVIEKGVTTIGAYAFRDCHALTSLTIPNSVTTIGIYAFENCSALTSFAVAADNPSYSSADGVLFDKDQEDLIQYPGGKQGAYTIPNSVTYIGIRAFSGCHALTSVTIPDSVTTIGEYAFSDCHALTSVTMGSSVTYIGDAAFENCDALLSVTIPNSVIYIRDAAFYDCDALLSVTIPDSVTYIGDVAFYDCDALTSVTMGSCVTAIGDWGFMLTTIEDNAFKNCDALTDVYYRGDEAEKEQLAIGSSNDDLFNATWHYI